MEIKGMLPETLSDWPGKLAVMVFTGGCNFRCGFCHNPAMVNGYNNLKTISEDYFLDYAAAQKRKGWKDGVVISGGEPTLHKDLPELIRKIKDIGLGVKLDTNGTNPGMLEQLFQQNLLDYVAMDIKTALTSYKDITQREIDPDVLRRSAKLVYDSNIDYEFRTTCIPKIVHSGTIICISRAMKSISNGSKPKKYVLQQYRNKDPGNPDFQTLDPDYMNIEPYPKKEMERLADLARPFFEKVELKLYD